MKPYLSSTSRIEVASVFNESDACRLPGPFYAVCFSQHPGVYMNWYAFLFIVMASYISHVLTLGI